MTVTSLPTRGFTFTKFTFKLSLIFNLEPNQKPLCLMLTHL